METESNNKKPIPYMWLDEDTGQPMLMGEPCLILFRDSFAALRSSVQRLVGSGAGAVLKEIGKDMGIRYAELTFKQLPKLKDLDIKTQIFEMCSIMLRNNGWGNIEITDLNIELNTTTINLRGHPSGCVQKDTDVPSCYLEAGLISGILEVITGEKESVVGFSCKQEDPCYTINIEKS